MRRWRNQRQWVKHHGTREKGRSTVALSQFIWGKPLIIKGRPNRIRISRVKKALTRRVKQFLKMPVPLLDGVKGRDSGESIIKDDIILWRQPLCTRVEYQRNQRRVFMGEADKDALTCTTVSFGNLLPILKSRIKHIDWTAKHMGTREVGMRCLCTKP